MERMQFAAPCLFGLEGPLADELRRLNAEDVRAEDGRVYFRGDRVFATKANVWLRCAERVLILLGSFEARTFDELFEGVKALPLEEYLPKNAAFPVKGHALDSKLMSVRDCQSIIKKAAAVRLASKYGLTHMPETGPLYQLSFFIRKDRVQLCLDTSGVGLHKRGYRAKSGDAPLRETLAAGLALLSRYRGREPFYDPFCGSGTIAVEAALIAKNRAPSLKRSFAFEQWPGFEKLLLGVWEEAASKEFSGEYRIFGSDIDEKAVILARENAEKAGVSELVRFELGDARGFDGESGGKVVSNLPYGVRMMTETEAARIASDFGSVTKDKGLELYLLSADPEFERRFGRKAAKKRKLYNGMIRCELFQYFNKNKS